MTNTLSSDFAVEFDAVSRHFGSVKALDEISLTIEPGEFFAMLGPSGSGKTTCLRLIAGFEQTTTGRIRIFGEDTLGIAPYRRPVNTVFQDYALFPHLSVADNVAYSLMIRKVSRHERRQEAERMLSMVHLQGYGDRRPSQLSGGQRQRVALARALINKPKVLLLDEPLGALDLKLREEMQEELRALQRSLGITFVFVTHDQGEALSMADRLAVFNEGRIMQIGTPKEIYYRPVSEFVARFVGSSNVLPAAFVDKLSGRSSIASLRPEAIKLVTEGGHHAQVLSINFLGASTRVVLQIEDIRLHALVDQNAESLSIGQSVHIDWKPSDLHLMDSASDHGQR